MKRTSIKNKILKAMISSSILSVLIISIISLLLMYRTLNNNAENASESTLSSYNGYVSIALQRIVNDLETAANSEYIFDKSISISERKNRLASSAETSIFKDFSVSNTDGLTYNDTDISDREYFIEAMKGNTYVSSPVIRRTDNSIIIMAGAKIRVSGFDGVIYGGIDMSYLNEIVSGIDFAEDSVGYIVDKAGTIIAHSNSKYVSDFTNYIDLAKNDKNLKPLSDMTNKAISESSGYDIYKVNGEEYLYAHSKLDNTDGWVLVISQPRKNVTSTYNQLLLICLAVIVLIIIGAITIAIFIGNKISSPIIHITRRLNSLSLGDLHSEVPRITTNDECQVLAEALGLTIGNLKDYIYDIDNVLQNIADGNLRVTSNVTYQGNFEQIKTSLETILESFNITFSEIGKAATQINEASAQVAAGASVLSENATNEAATIEELSSSIEDIHQNTNENAENAKLAADLTNNAKNQVDIGSDRMNAMMKAVSNIEKSSDEIAKIIKVIDDIAFQTNILALNAAVEAARAGSAGKGFAVVADEVRNLAIRSSDAARTTNELIVASISDIREGANHSKQTSEAINSIAEMVIEINNLMENIAMASADQANAISQISAGMDNITISVQTTSATAEESAATSEELSSQAVATQNMISKFKTKY